MSTRRLKALLGDHPVTEALKQGRIATAGLAFDFADVKVPHTGRVDVGDDVEITVNLEAGKDVSPAATN